MLFSFLCNFHSEGINFTNQNVVFFSEEEEDHSNSYF